MRVIDGFLIKGVSVSKRMHRVLSSHLAHSLVVVSTGRGRRNLFTASPSSKKKSIYTCPPWMPPGSMREIGHAETLREHCGRMHPMRWTLSSDFTLMSPNKRNFQWGIRYQVVYPYTHPPPPLFGHCTLDR